MSNQFEEDLKQALTAVKAAHSTLLAFLADLSDEDLDLSLPGNWTIRRVLQHIGQSYGFYLEIILGARGRNTAEVSKVAITDLSSPAEASRLLHAGFEAVVAATDGVDEETFYRLLPARDTNEYSVLSTLEGVAAHDHEHTEQIKIIAKSAS